MVFGVSSFQTDLHILQGQYTVSKNSPYFCCHDQKHRAAQPRIQRILESYDSTRGLSDLDKNPFRHGIAMGIPLGSSSISSCDFPWGPLTDPYVNGRLMLAHDWGQK